MARTFNGSSDHIAFGSDASCDQLSAFTAYALVRPTATVSGEKQVLTKMTSGFVGKMYIALDATDKIFCFINRATTNCTAASANSAIVTNTWNVVVVTWAGVGNAPVIYRCDLGGTLTDITSTSAVGSGSLFDDSSALLRLATRDPLDATFYGGGLADCALWNRVLNSTELNSLGAGNSPEFNTSGLVFASRITGTASPEINTTGGTNGTVTGTSLLTHPSVTYPGTNKAGGVVSGGVLKSLVGGALAA